MGKRAAAALRTLAAELVAECAEVSLVVDEISTSTLEMSVGSTRAREWYGLAAMVEGMYTGIERALVRVAGEFGGPPAGGDWHARLLQQSALAVPGERGAILSGSSTAALRDLLAFRHRVRNLYGHRPDRSRVMEVARAATAASPGVEADLLAFAGTLRAAATALDGDP